MDEFSGSAGVSFGEHVSEDKLEEYCLGKLAPHDLEDLENHVLVCAECQDRLEETDAFVKAIRQATGKLAADTRWQRQRPRPRMAAMAVAAVVCVVAIALGWGVSSSLRTRGSEPPFAAKLELTRGGGDNLRARVPADRPLLLTLDLTGVAPLETYRVRIVKADGAPVFDSTERLSHRTLSVAAPPSLTAGTYWVRVYDPSAPETALREYGLEVK